MLSYASGVGRALAHAWRRVVEQTSEHGGGYGAVPQKLRGDPSHARVVGADRRLQQGDGSGVGDAPGQRILRALNVGRVLEAPQAGVIAAHPEVAELVADQITDYRVGVGERI